MFKYFIIIIIPISLYSQINTGYVDIMRSAIKADGIAEISDDNFIDTLFSKIKVTKKYYSKIGENNSMELIYINIQNVDYKMLVYDGQYFFRIKGFKENDYIHFYNFIMKQSLNAWKIEMNSLYQFDTIFSSIDFDCLNTSIKRGENNTECMESFIFKNPTYVKVGSAKDLNKSCFHESIYSYFSNKPYYGCIPLGWRRAQHKKN